MLAEAAAHGRTCAVMVLDIDRFKSVNDRFGHAAGDKVLTGVSARLSVALRPGDLIARIGGEEFLVALPGVTEAEALILAERLRHAVSERPFAIDLSEPPLRVTVSIGVALASTPAETAESALARADRALLAAKADGRDQVMNAGRNAA
ncbi:MAG: GGDEF domain-containing protein, partial [Gemmobacter sp.]